MRTVRAAGSSSSSKKALFSLDSVSQSPAGTPDAAIAEKRYMPNDMQAALARKQATQKLVFAFFWLMALSAVAVLLYVIGYVVVHGIGQLSLDFLFTPPKGGLAGEGGISSPTLTTIYLVLLTLAIATPLGVGAAIYLVEYAGEMQGKSGLIARLVSIARFGVETLAGVPSIIFGLFGYALFVIQMQFGFSILAAGLAGACLVLPVIVRTSEEALKAVPKSYREGSLALGATQLQMIWTVVLPAAMPGIITGVVLSVGRILGETAIFYVTLGGSFNMPTSLLSSGRTLALHVYYLAMDTRAFDKAMATAAVLILVIILLNALVNYISNHVSKRMRGE